MEGNEQIGPQRSRDVHPLAQWNENVAVAGQLHTITAGRLERFAQFFRDAEHQILFLNPGAPMRAGVDSAMAGIYNHKAFFGIVPLHRRGQRCRRRR